MKAIVTGAAGFIGSHLCEELVSKGYEVTGVDSFLDYYPRWIKESNLQKLRTATGFQLLDQNILDVDWGPLLSTTDVVFHLAAQAGVRSSWSKNFIIYTKNNIEATQLLLEESKRCNLKKFVFASTSSVYGDTEEIPMKEEALLKPVSPYGVTKVAAEDLCYLYWRSFGIPCVSLRYFTVYGPRQRPDMGFYRFILATLEGRSITVFEDGNQTRDFTYVDDIVRGTILASEKGKEGQVYNLGGGSRISVNEVLQMLGEIMNTKIDMKYAEKQKGDMRHTFASTDLAKIDFDYNPKIPLKEGLTAEYQWLKKLFADGRSYRME
ncbi:NAD-dependent epimerase/dehydratase family protein [bacterium]|nr:NAD-dependent epimerase/dehydratase family protein [bacterium]